MWGIGVVGRGNRRVHVLAVLTAGIGRAFVGFHCMIAFL